MKSREAVLLLVIGLAGCGPWVAPQKAHVFAVTGHDCRGRDWLGQGVRTTAAGQVGLVTPLHGVVGCESLTADRGSEHLDGLEIVQVDVRHDVALLSNPRLDAATESLAASAEAPPELEPLSRLLGADERTTLLQRRSPALDSQVLRLQHATRSAVGAPVLARDGSLLAVINGIEGASGPVGWAVLYRDIDWSPTVQNETEMDWLATLPATLW